MDKIDARNFLVHNQCLYFTAEDGRDIIDAIPTTHESDISCNVEEDQGNNFIGVNGHIIFFLNQACTLLSQCDKSIYEFTNKKKILHRLVSTISSDSIPLLHVETKLLSSIFDWMNPEGRSIVGAILTSLLSQNKS